jgi:hypothetical protein
MMRSLSRFSLLLLILVLSVVGCKKYKDEPGGSDPRLSRSYCNDPEAVNYNHDFPGTADNSVCYYPTDAFKGNFLFVDSVYTGATNLVAQNTFQLQLTGESRTKLLVGGFCGGGELLKFTANRALRANSDTTVLNGQLMCRVKDTMSGYITRSLADSTRLKFYFTVVSDTGITQHRGTAYRQ